MMLHRKKLTREQALQRSKIFCGYQERCHYETKQKLISFGLARNEVEQIISALIDEDYLNEARFAAAFARGKFRIKGWGRIKIRYELRQKKVSDHCIKTAMDEIDEVEYMKTLDRLYDGKLEELEQETDPLAKKRKAKDYLLQKGFELDLIMKKIS
jgi:regulatory protein